MKVRVDLMENQNNSTWQLSEIPNGTGLSNDQDSGGTPITPSRLDPFVLNKPNAAAKFYNKRVTYEIPITIADYWTNPDAIRFTNKTIALYKKYMAAASCLYNEGDYVTFTPEDRLKAVFLAEYVKDAETYLYSDTFHKEFVELSGYDEVGYWQGQSTDDSLDSRSTIAGTFVDNNEKTVTGGIDGVIAILFDEEAAAVVCEHDRTTSQRNARAEYVNYFYKYDCGIINDLEENCVLFYVSDDTVAGSFGSSAPATWDSAYAISSSPYYIWDDTTEDYRQLTADDKTTAAGYDWDDYANRSYLYKPTT